jgi:hypothetical protein
VDSSGVTAIDTSGDTAVTLLTCTQTRHTVTVINTSGIIGAVSLNNGTTYFKWPTDLKAQTFEFPHRGIIPVVKFKRVASGTDVTGLYAYAY